MRARLWMAGAALAGPGLLTACGGEEPADGRGGAAAELPSATASGESVPSPWFREEAGERGLVFEHRSGHDGQRYLFPEIMGGGGALLDVDDDGDLDAYLVQGGAIEAPPAERPPNQLFANDGSGRFRDVTAESGAGDRGYGMGVAVGDADGDGSADLFVTNLGPNTLLLNDGAGRFRDASAERGADDASWGTSTLFLDAERDGDLDLYVVNYVHWSVADELLCSAVPHGADYCSPLSYRNPAPDLLLRNDGSGRFEDVSSQAGLRSAFGNGLGVVAADFDGDGWLDLFVANDGMVNQLWQNRGDGTFVDRAAQRGSAVDQNGRTKAGMGIDSVDLDDDGDEDVLVVNLHGESDSYYRNEGTYFSDRTPLVGLATASKPFTRFGCGFADFDADGRLDLFEANGRVTKASEPERWGFFSEPNLLFRGVGERGPSGTPRFEEVEPRGGTARLLVETSRAVCFGDVDGDGGVDVLVVNRDGPARLLRNALPERGHWLSLRVREASGADALGALVTCTIDGRRVTRRVKSGYSYLSASDAAVHLGLGPSTSALDVRVTWVDGQEEAFGELSADRVVTLRRGQGRR